MRMGYRQLGLRYEDLLPEENEVTQLALKRLPPKEAYDRVFRLRRAFQVGILLLRIFDIISNIGQTAFSIASTSS